MLADLEISADRPARSRQASSGALAAEDGGVEGLVDLPKNVMTAPRDDERDAKADGRCASDSHANIDERSTPQGIDSPPSIGRLLEQSEDIKDVVEQCASAMSLVNADIAEGLKGQVSVAVVASALSKNVELQDKVQVASEMLALVTVGLANQTRERQLVDRELAAAQEQEEAARHASLNDVLTRLPNRALFDDRLKLGLAQAVRHGWVLAVMFIDLDHFKRINDTFGHGTGDRVLQAVGQRLGRCTRSDDTVSRYGGDEFLYLLMEIKDEMHVALVAEKILEVIRRPGDDTEGDLKGVPPITASLGIAVFPSDGGTCDELLKAADAALYSAKRHGVGYAFADRMTRRSTRDDMNVLRPSTR